MKVLVVGGAGYIGSHTVYELIRAGHDVAVFDNLSTGVRHAVHEKARFYEGSICHKDEMAACVAAEQARGPIDVVMHFAAKLIVPESVKMPLEYYYNNVEGVRVMLECMAEAGIKNVVFSSTAAVYGEPATGVCHEDDALSPINPYGETKLACEKMIQWVCAAYDMNYCIFRYFNVAGADATLEIGLEKETVTWLVPIIMQAALGQRDKVLICGTDYDTPDGTCVRDYVHVTDLARAHVLGANFVCEKHENLLLNLGSGDGYSVREMVDAALEIIDVPYEEGERRGGDPAKLIACADKAYEVLGWKPEIGLKEILQSDLDFRRKLKD
ncbi:MAG: UDP-glucose 4-epimerase GalE [Raoultibacter sp.]